MAGTATQILYRPKPNQAVIQIDWLGSSTSGTLSTVATSEYINKAIYGMYCVCGITNPGATTKPTDNYDIAVNDSFGCDIFGGELGNRDSGTTEQVVPKIGNAYMARPVFTGLSIAITNNTVASSSGSIFLVFVE